MLRNIPGNPPGYLRKVLMAVLIASCAGIAAIILTL
jgi:hypothetical protein